MWKRPLLVGALAAASVGDETTIGSLDFLDCTGEGFDPAWASFKATLPFPLSPSTPLSERAVSEASNLLDAVEEYDWALLVAAFSSRLRGEPDAKEQLDAAVCMGAMVRKRAAFLILAFTMTQMKQVLPSDGNRVGGCAGFTFWRSPRLPPSTPSSLHRRPETQTRTSSAVTSGFSERPRWIWPVPDGVESALAALAGCFFFAYSAWLSFLGFCAGFPAAALWTFALACGVPNSQTFAIGYAIGLLCGIFLYKFDSGIQVASGAGVLLGVVAAKCEADLVGDFCLFGVATAYAVVAFHLSRAAPEPAPPTAKSSAARALPLGKQVNDFLESSTWPLRSMDLVALLELEEPDQVRAMAEEFRLPCWLRLGCAQTLATAEAKALVPPPPPLPASWPQKVVAVGLHTTSTLEVVSALRDSVSEAWGRGGAGGAPFKVEFAGHPCPSHAGSEHHCAMRCELLGLCDAAADAADPLAEFVLGAVDVAKFEERESYALDEARAALKWAPRRLEPLRQAELIVCTFPTVLCVLLSELLPEPLAQHPYASSCKTQAAN
eukprot:s1386_g4.t2